MAQYVKYRKLGPLREVCGGCALQLFRGTCFAKIKSKKNIYIAKNKAKIHIHIKQIVTKNSFRGSRAVAAATSTITTTANYNYV